MRNTPTRRGILRSTAGVATAGALGSIASGGASASPVTGEPADVIPRTPEEIHAAFADVPYNDDPTDLERAVAPMRFPEPAIPEDGSVPDPVDRVHVEIDPPAWALATAYDKARRSRERGGDVDRADVGDRLLEIAYAHEEWVLPDGSDAVDAILAAVEADTDG